MNPNAAMRTPAIAAEARAPSPGRESEEDGPLASCADLDALGGRESCITRAGCVGAEQSDRKGTRARHMGCLGAESRRSEAHRSLQAFPNLGCFSPSFSKESFGRFVGFQWIARLPNPK